jgi:hypothetical protein
VIQLVGERSWEDVNYNGQGHRTCVNMELVMFFQLLYPDMVHVGAQRVATCSWTHWCSGNMLTRDLSRMRW